MGAIQNSPQACILFHSWFFIFLFFLGNQREHEAKRERETRLADLAPRLNGGLFWSQCGMVSTELEQDIWWVFREDFRINHEHPMAGANPAEEILISFWTLRLFFLKLASSPHQCD